MVKFLGGDVPSVVKEGVEFDEVKESNNFKHLKSWGIF